MNYEFYLDKIKNRYNPEHDIHDDGLMVSWAENVLATIVESLVNRIEELENKINSLERNKINENEFSQKFIIGVRYDAKMIENDEWIRITCESAEDEESDEYTIRFRDDNGFVWYENELTNFIEI